MLYPACSITMYFAPIIQLHLPFTLLQRVTSPQTHFHSTTTTWVKMSVLTLNFLHGHFFHSCYLIFWKSLVNTKVSDWPAFHWPPLIGRSVDKSLVKYWSSDFFFLTGPNIQEIIRRTSKQDNPMKLWNSYYLDLIGMNIKKNLRLLELQYPEKLHKIL